MTLAQPSAWRLPAALSHATFTDDTDRHAGASGNVMEPVVTVLSVYDVPSGLAVHDPVTCSEPVTGTLLHPRLARVTSMSPEMFRQDDATVQVPTTEPLQGVSPGQLPPEVPPLPLVVLVPPEPGDPPLPPPRLADPQPLPATAAMRATEPTSPFSLIRIRPRGRNCRMGGVLFTVFVFCVPQSGTMTRGAADVPLLVG